MQIDISFDFAKIFNIDKFVNVVKGQKFSLITDSALKISFFSNNDPVLAISNTDTSADIEATDVGQSTMLLMDSNSTILKTLIFVVVDSIQEPAANLNASSEVVNK